MHLVLCILVKYIKRCNVFFARGIPWLWHPLLCLDSVLHERVFWACVYMQCVKMIRIKSNQISRCGTNKGMPSFFLYKLITKAPTGHKPRLKAVFVCAHPHMYQWIKDATSAMPPHGTKKESHCFHLSWNGNLSWSARASSASATDGDKKGDAIAVMSVFSQMDKPGWQAFRPR